MFMVNLENCGEVIDRGNPDANGVRKGVRKILKKGKQIR